MRSRTSSGPFICSTVKGEEAKGGEFLFRWFDRYFSFFFFEIFHIYDWTEKIFLNFPASGLLLRLLTYKISGVVVGEQGESYRGEKPADICREAVIRDLATAQQQDLAETVEHPRAGLMHCYHYALPLLFRVLLQPWNQRLCRMGVQPARWFLVIVPIYIISFISNKYQY